MSSESPNPISPDVLIMYVIAFFLDLIGYICLLLLITVMLAPLALIIQGITSFLGGFIFTIWIVFFRHSSMTTAAKKVFTRKGSKSKDRKEGPETKKSNSSPSAKNVSEGSDLPVSAPSQPSFDEQLSNKMPVETTSLLKKWVKRVLLPWIVESVPILGKISPTWIIAVHSEATHA